MKILVIGATGDIGRSSVRALVAAGHEVIGTTRSNDKTSMIAEMGARAVVVDVLDTAAIREVIGASGADVVVQLLTALPRGGPTSLEDLRETNRLRRDVTPVLVGSARAAGIHRYVSESLVLGYLDTGDAVADESAPFAASPRGPAAEALEALAVHERSILDAGGIALRFGFFYGPGVGSTDGLRGMLASGKLRMPRAGLGALPWIHIDDAAAAVLAAVESDRSAEVYNIVDDAPASMRSYAEQVAASAGLRSPGGVPWWLIRRVAPYAAYLMKLRLRLSNEKARRDLEWRPRYATIAEGLRAATPA